MGQSMRLSQEGVAEYEVSFRTLPSGVDVTLAVRSLDAALNQPMGAPGTLRMEPEDHWRWRLTWLHK